MPCPCPVCLGHRRDRPAAPDRPAVPLGAQPNCTVSDRAWTDQERIFGQNLPNALMAKPFPEPYAWLSPAQRQRARGLALTIWQVRCVAVPALAPLRLPSRCLPLPLLADLPPFTSASSHHPRSPLIYASLPCHGSAAGRRGPRPRGEAALRGSRSAEHGPPHCPVARPASWQWERSRRRSAHPCPQSRAPVALPTARPSRSAGGDGRRAPFAGASAPRLVVTPPALARRGAREIASVCTHQPTCCAPLPPCHWRCSDHPPMLYRWASSPQMSRAGATPLTLAGSGH